MIIIPGPQAEQLTEVTTQYDSLRRTYVAHMLGEAVIHQAVQEDILTKAVLSSLTDEEFNQYQEQNENIPDEERLAAFEASPRARIITAEQDFLTEVAGLDRLPPYRFQTVALGYLSLQRQESSADSVGSILLSATAAGGELHVTKRLWGFNPGRPDHPVERRDLPVTADDIDAIGQATTKIAWANHVLAGSEPAWYKEAMETHPQLPDLRETPLHEVTQQYGVEGLQEQFRQLVGECDNLTPVDTERIYDALDLTLKVHEGQTRGAHPYATHVLRVASRVIKHFDVRDPDIIIAALLHDSVEDQPGRLVFGVDATPEMAEDPRYKQAASIFIRERFGGTVADIVASVTNPEFDPDRDKHAQYREHVAEAMQEDPKARIIKLSDFTDNCSGIIYNENPARAVRLAGKYLPLIPTMIEFANDPTTPLEPEARAYVTERLHRAEKRCKKLIAEAE